MSRTRITATPTWSFRRSTKPFGLAMQRLRKARLRILHRASSAPRKLWRTHVPRFAHVSASEAESSNDPADDYADQHAHRDDSEEREHADRQGKLPRSE